MWRKNAATIFAGGLLGVLLVVYMSTYQVRYSEVAIVKTFGRISHVETNPGLRGKWPWPIQQVVILDKRVNVMEDPLSETLTEGQKPVTAQTYLAWRIKDPERFLVRVGSVRNANAQLQTKLKSVKESVLGGYSLGNFVSTNAADLKLPEVDKAIREDIGAWADAQLGVEVMAVGLNRLGVPPSNSKDIFEAMKQGRAQLVAEYQGQGQGEAQRIVTGADGTSTKIMAFANRRAEELRAEGLEKAYEQYKAFQENEQFAVFLKELGMLSQTLTSNTTILLDPMTPPFSYFRTPPTPATLPAQPVRASYPMSGVPSGDPSANR
jgi:membrane protease subunit HflC